MVGGDDGGIGDVGDVLDRGDAEHAVVDGAVGGGFARVPVAVVGVARAGRVLERRGIDVGLALARVFAVGALSDGDLLASAGAVEAAAAVRIEGGGRADALVLADVAGAGLEGRGALGDGEDFAGAALARVDAAVESRAVLALIVVKEGDAALILVQILALAGLGEGDLATGAVDEVRANLELRAVSAGTRLLIDEIAAVLVEMLAAARLRLWVARLQFVRTEVAHALVLRLHLQAEILIEGAAGA